VTQRKSSLKISEKAGYPAFSLSLEPPVLACARPHFNQDRDTAKIFVDCGGSERLRKILKIMKLALDK
jgi:hypothetical protein